MGDESQDAQIIRIPGLNASDTWDVRCHASVKLRDEAGEYLRDEAGKVLTRPCKNWAVRFAMVCHAHGAGGTAETNPTRAKADRARDELRDKLRELGDQAVDTVSSVMRTAEKDADRIRAAEMVLSRFVPTKTEAEVTTHKVDHEDLDREIDEALGDLQLLKAEDEEDQADSA